MAELDDNDGAAAPEAPPPSAPEPSPGGEAPPLAASGPPAASPGATRPYALSGALLAAFVVLHLLVHASALGGPTLYDRFAGALARSPVAVVLEVFVAAALVVHVTIGLRAFGRRRASGAELARWGGRNAFIAQRISAVVLLVLLIAHVVELRLGRRSFGVDALHTVMVAHLSSTSAGIPWVALLYFAGVGAATFHLAMGLAAASRTARARRAAYALGVACFLVGGVTVTTLATGGRLFPVADVAPLPCGSAVSTDRPAPPPR